MSRLSKQVKDGLRRRRRRDAKVRSPESLEKRQLLAVAPFERPDELVTTISGGRPLVVVDASLPAPASFSRSFGDAAATVVVGPGDDLFASVAAELDRLGGASAIHVVSHGQPGGFTLGSTRFAVDTIDQIDDGLIAWNRLAGPGSDLFLWGCDIAAGDGASLLDAIHAVSGFDVAASIDLTGPASLGGDFDLEYARGDVGDPGFVAGVGVLWETTLSDYTFTAASRTEMQAAFNRLNDTVAPAIKAQLDSRTGSSSTDSLLQRTVSDLFTDSTSITPADLQNFLQLKTTVSTYFTTAQNSGVNATLSGLKAAIESALNTKANTAVGPAGSRTITVTPSFVGNIVSLQVAITATGTKQDDVALGTDLVPTTWGKVVQTLNSDYGGFFRTSPRLETGTTGTTGFTVQVDVSNANAPTASLAIATTNLAGGIYSFGPGLRFGILDATIGGGASLPYSTTVSFGAPGANRSIDDWATPSASASPLGTPSTTLDLPITASISGVPVTSATSKLRIVSTDPTGLVPPTITGIDLGLLPWFGAITSDALINAVKQVGGAFGVIGTNEALTASIPFVQRTSLLDVFAFEDLFDDAIASVIDVSVPTVMPAEAGTGLTFSVTAGGSQLTLTGDKRSEVAVGQPIGLTPSTPTAGDAVIRTVTAVTLSGGNTLVTIDAAIDGTTTAGSLVGTTPVRPDNLQTLADFQAYPAFAGLGITPVYNAANGTVSMQFAVTRTSPAAATAAIDFNAAPLGAVTFASGGVTGTTALKVAFGIEFDIGPGSPIVISLGAEPATTFRLPGDATFTITPVGGSTTTVTVTKASTETNTTLADLVADMNAVLGSTLLRARQSELGFGIELYTPTVNTGMPIGITVEATRNEGAIALGFADGIELNDGTKDVPITLFARPSGVTSRIVPHSDPAKKFAESTLDWKLDGLAGTVGYGINTVAFATTDGDVDATYSAVLAAGGGSAGDIIVDTPGLLTPAFSGSGSLSLQTLSRVGATTNDIAPTAAITIAVNDLTAERIDSFVDIGAVLAVPGLEDSGRGTGRLSADAKVRFTAGGTTYEVTVTQATAANNTSFADLVADFNQALLAANRVVNGTTDTSSSFSLAGQFSFAGSGGRVSVMAFASGVWYPVVENLLVPNLAAGGGETGRLTTASSLSVIRGANTYTVTVPASATTTNTTFADLVADLNAAFTTARRRLPSQTVPNLVTGGATNGRLAADVTLEISRGVDIYDVTVLAAATSTNTTFADLVADFNAALETAQRRTDAGPVTVDARSLLVFSAGQTSGQIEPASIEDASGLVRFRTTGTAGRVQPQSVQEIANPNYAIVTLPAAAIMGEIGYQAGLSVQSIAGALGNAARVFDVLERDLEEYTDQAIPFIGQPLSELIDLNGGLAGRIQAFGKLSASSPQELERALETSLGVPSSDLRITYDSDRKAYRIDFVYRASKQATVPFDVDMGVYYELLGKPLPKGIDSLIDGEGKTPLSVVVNSTSVISVGYDLVNAKTFLYGHDGTTDHGLTNGTSFRITFSVNGQNLTFPAKFGLDVRNGTAALQNGELVVELDGPKVEKQFTGSGTTLSLASTTGLAVGMLVRGNGIPAGTRISQVNGATQVTLSNSVTSFTGFATFTTPSSRYEIAPGSGELAALDIDNYAATFGGSARAKMPIFDAFAPANLTVQSQQEMLASVDDPTRLADHPASFYLSLPDLGGYLDAVSRLEEARDAITTLTNAGKTVDAAGIQLGNELDRLGFFGSEEYLRWRASWRGRLETAAEDLGGVLFAFAPELENSRNLLGAQETLVDYIRDPAMILDKLNAAIGGVESALKGLDKIPLPFMEGKLGGAVNSIFSFRTGWLLDMRNKMRGAGEGIFDVMRQSVFEYLGPKHANILLKYDPISMDRSLDSMVSATRPEDIGVVFMDKNREVLLNDVRGADAFEIVFRLGQKVFDTGIDMSFQLDALESIGVGAAFDGGLRLQVGWEMLLGFGFSITDGFYLKVDSTGDSGSRGNFSGSAGQFEAQLRFDATLTGASKDYTQRWDAGAGYWKIVDTMGTAVTTDDVDVIDATTGQAYRAIAVNNQATDVTAQVSTDPAVYDPCGCGEQPSATDSGQKIWWVVGTDSGNGSFVPAELNDQGMYVPQTSGYPHTLIEVTAMRPAQLSGSLFFLRLAATDKIRRGLSGFTDVDSQYFYDASDGPQVTADQRDDEATGVNRNNELPTRFSAAVGLNMVDPSASAGRNTVRDAGYTVGGPGTKRVISPAGTPLEGNSGAIAKPGTAWAYAPLFWQQSEIEGVYAKEYYEFKLKVAPPSRLDALDFPVRVATGGNVALRGMGIIDGVQLKVGDRVLVKNQALAEENGIYTVSPGGWSRAFDADDNADFNTGSGKPMFVMVGEGRSNAGTGWNLLADTGNVTLGTTPLYFERTMVSIREPLPLGLYLTRLVPYEPYVVLPIRADLIDQNQAGGKINIQVEYDQQNYFVTLDTSTGGTGAALRTAQLNQALAQAVPAQLNAAGEVEAVPGNTTTKNLFQAGFTFATPGEADKKWYRIQFARLKDVDGVVSRQATRAGTFVDYGTPVDRTYIDTQKGWEPIADINADASPGRITWRELKSAGFKNTFQVDFQAEAVANLTMELSVGDTASSANLSIPRIFADFNLDWSTRAARARIDKAKVAAKDQDQANTQGTSQQAADDGDMGLKALFAEEDEKTQAKTAPGGDRGINPASPLVKEMDLKPEIGFNNIRLDVGSFLTKFIKPVIDEAEPYLSQVRPVLQFFDSRIPVLSDITGRTIKVVDLLEAYGGPKGKTVRAVIDVVTAVDNLVARIAALPQGVNIQIPMGRFWFPKQFGDQATLNGAAPAPGAQYKYGDLVYDNLALGKRASGFYGGTNNAAGANAAAKAAIDALRATNPDSDEQKRKQGFISNNAADRGGLRVPLLDDPLNLFQLMMGKTATLVTYQLPKLRYEFEKEIPLLKIVCFEVGLRASFEMNSNLAFGFDTYGINQYMVSGDIADIAQGFYVSDRANADGTGADVPEFQAIVSFGLYGGINLVLAKGGIEGGLRVIGEVNLNDPNNDGKLRLTEAIGLVVDTGNPLDLFDLSLRGEVYARYYYQVGVGKLAIKGGKTFARVEIFNLVHEGSDGTPIYASRLDGTEGDAVPGTLLIHVGEAAPKRVSNQDPLDARDGAERFKIWSDGTTVSVQYLNYSESITKTWSGVTRVVFEGGLGNDELDASGLNGIPLIFKGGDGNDRVTLGSGHGSTVSRIEGDDGNDTIVVIGGGIVELVGGVGNDAITGGTGIVRIEAGEGNDSVTTRAGSTSTIVMAEDYGLDTAILAAAALQNLLDFTSLASAIEFLLDGALGASVDGTATAGEKNVLTFNVGGATEIRGSAQADTYTVRNPRTRNVSRSGTNMNGLLLRGGQGDDVYDFVLDTVASIAADGILIDDVQAVTPAVAGTVTRCGSCNKIESIAVQSAGEGYELPPQVMIIDPTGSGAQAVAVLDERGRVTSIQIIEGGEGYTDPRVTLVAPRSLGDALTISSVRPAGTLWVQTPASDQKSQQYEYQLDGKGVRFVGWGDAARPVGLDQSEIDSVTINMPEGVLTLGSAVNLFQTFTVNASRMVQNARIVADTVEITTDHGFQVKHPIHAVNSGDVKLRVTGDGTNTGEGDLNAAANRATAAAIVSAGGVASLSLTNAGDNYFFTPSITVGSDGITPGTGARFAATLAGNGGGLSGFTQLAPGSGYYSSPAPVVVVPPPASIQIDAMITSSLPNGYVSFGLGNGRGRVLLFADSGAVSTSSEVFFPEDARPGTPRGSRTIDWIGGDFRYRSTVGLDDLVSPTQYPGISVGTGAEFTAILDADGRVVGFTKVSGGSGYSSDLPPLIEIEGLATAVVDSYGANGSILSLRVTYPGDGYGQPPRVTIKPNGFGRIVNSPNGVGSGLSSDGVTPMNRVHIRALGGTLVAVAGAGVGDPLKPLKSDVEKFVAQVTATGGVHVLEKDGLRIGKDQSVAGITTVNGDVSITTFGGTLELGAPRQALDEQGRPLWQDAAKTIPIYDRDPVTGRIIYEGGDIAVGSGDVKLTADDVEVNVDLNASGGSGTITLQPVRVNAEIGLAGTRARIEGVVTNGQLTGFDATKFWGGRGYTTAPLVIVDPAGQRAYASAVVEAGAVTAIDVIYGGTNYDPANPPTVTLSGGGISNNTPTNRATATAIVGDDGVITGFTITNAGSGYVSSPSIAIASPGQALVQAVLDTDNPDPVTGRFAVKEFVITNPGRNYQAAPNIEVAAPYDFTLDADEVQKFAESFAQVVIGRIEGQHLFHSPEAAFDGAVVLRAPRSGGTLDVASFTTSGPVSIVGSGNTFHFDGASPSLSGTSISIDDNVIVHEGVDGSATATTGSIVVFGTGKGMIDGDPAGDDVGDDEDLVLAAHTFVTVTGAIGSRWALDDLTVTSATRGAIDLQQSVTLTGDLGITGGAVTIGGVVDVDGDLVIDASSMVLFSSDVYVGGNLTITNATGVTFAGSLTVGGSLSISQVPGAVRFGGIVDVTGPLDVTAGTLIEVLGGLITTESTTFTANEVEFKGGTASITGAATKTLTVQPFTASRPIRVGTPNGSGSGTLDVSDADLAAIATGWGRVVIGNAAAGTGAVTIGSIGTQQGSRNSWLANSTTIVGGSVTVAQKVDAANGSGELLLRARTGDVTVNAAINETVTDRSATVSMEAAGAISITAPVSAAQTINLTSGGTTSQTAAGPLATPHLRVDSQGAVSLLSPTNAFDLLAVATSNDDIAIREDSGYEIGSIAGVIGIQVGTATARLISSGLVTQAYAIDAGRLELQGTGGRWVLTAGNTIGTLTADTGSFHVADAAQLNVGSLVASQQTGTAITLSAPAGLSLTAPITTAGGDVVLNNAVTLTADVAIDVVDGGRIGLVTIMSSVDGTTAGQESLSITGDFDARGSIGSTTALEGLSVSGDSTLAAGIALRTTGNQTYSGGATSTGTVTIQAADGSTVSFLGTVSLGGLVTATATGAESFNVALTGAAVSITNPVTFANAGTVTLGDQTTDDLHFVAGITSAAPATTKLAGTIRTTNASGSFGRTPGGNVELTADTTVSTGAGTATFGGTVDGPHRLVVNAAGDTTFAAAVGGTAPLAHVETDAAGRTLVNGGAVTTGSPTSQVYNDPVLLGANTVFTAQASGAITFVSTLDGAFTATVNTQGIRTFGGAVGSTAALASLLTDAGGTTRINGGSVTTTGSQTYNDASTLGANATLSGSAITFATTVDGAFTLTANSQGLTTFGGAVGGNTSLASLTTDAGGTTRINGGAVTTTGSQTYNDAATLGAATTLSGSAITFATTLDGAFALTANSQGLTTFGGAVGGQTALASLTTDTGGTTRINGGSVTTTGSQTYNDVATLGAATTLSGSAITFATTLDGAFALAANTQGLTTFGGAVGGNTALASLTTDAGGSTQINGGAITTTGSQTYNDAATLGAATTLSGSAITFATTLDGAFALTANSQGLTTFGGAVGGQAALASLVTDAGGTTRISGGSVTTTGSQTYNDAATLGANATLAGDALTFATTLDGAFALAANSQGLTTFGGAVGGQAALASLTTDAGGTTRINGGAVTTIGNQTYADAVTLGANATLTGVDVRFMSTLDGGSGLVVNASGVTFFDAAVGSVTPLASVTTNAAGSTVIGGGSVRTSGTQTWLDTVVLTTDTAFTSSGGSILAGPANVFQASGRDVSFTAATGIGTAAAPIRIAAAEVTAEVTGSGGISIVGVGDLIVGAAGLLAPGQIALDASGTIRVPTGATIASGPVSATKPIHWSVTTTANSGAGSLRQVIANANAVGNANASGRDAVILFSGLPNPAVFVLQAQLPTIAADVAIDGSGASIVIDGNRAVQHGLIYGSQAAGSLLKGVTLANFSHFGIQLLGAQGVTVDGVTVRSVNTETSMGLYATGDLAGTRVLGSTFSGGLRGALLDNARNLVFGQIGRGNVLSNNQAAPTNPAFAGTGIRAQGLLTGTVVAGNTFTGNNFGFAFIGANNLRLERNTFARNSVAGIYIEGDNRGSSHTGSVFATARQDRNRANVVRLKRSTFGGPAVTAVAPTQAVVIQKQR